MLSNLQSDTNFMTLKNAFSSNNIEDAMGGLLPPLMATGGGAKNFGTAAAYYDADMMFELTRSKEQVITSQYFKFNSLYTPSS